MWHELHLLVSGQVNKIHLGKFLTFFIQMMLKENENSYLISIFCLPSLVPCTNTTEVLPQLKSSLHFNPRSKYLPPIKTRVKLVLLLCTLRVLHFKNRPDDICRLRLLD